MRKLWWMILMLCSSAVAQYSAVTGFCTSGANQALVSGLKSTNTLQGIVPRCTVAVYNTGTLTPAVIYSSSTGTVLANPFTANQSGQWLFYASGSTQYDVQMSGGVPPNVFATPITLTGIGSTGGSGGVITPAQYVASPPDGRLNVKNYVLAAGGTWSGDITSVLDSVVSLANSTGAVTYFPTGSVCWTHQETFLYAVEGDARGISRASACAGSSANFPSGTALIRLCIKVSETGSYPVIPGGLCPSSIRDMYLAGLATSPTTLTGNPNDIGSFRGTGILVDQLANKTLITDNQITNFYKGIDLNPNGGHVYTTRTLSNSSWYNAWVSNASGDMQFVDSDLSGSPYTSLGANGTDSSGVAASGLVGVSVIRTHTGFAPYAVRVESGAGENGLIGFHMEDSPQEQVGNECIYIGTNTGGDGFRSVGLVQVEHSACVFTSFSQYKIIGQSSFPSQDYAITFDFTNSLNLLDFASAMPVGTTGFVGLVRHPQANLYVSSEVEASLWTGGGNTLSSVGSGIVNNNTSSNSKACALYVNNVTSGGFYQDIQAATACFLDSSGYLHTSPQVADHYGSMAVDSQTGFNTFVYLNGDGTKPVGIRFTGGSVQTDLQTDPGSNIIHLRNVGTNNSPLSVDMTAPDGSVTVQSTGNTALRAIVLQQAAPTTGVGQLGLGSTTAAATNCNQSGTLTGVTLCLIINLAGTTHYVPVF